MTVDLEYCLDPVTQLHCNGLLQPPSALLQGRTVFYGVQPKYMNVDIRIVVDISAGGGQNFLDWKVMVVGCHTANAIWGLLDSVVL